MKINIIPIFIPHLGCPHLCTFCNQKKISGSLKAPDKNEILALVDEYLKADFSKVYEIGFFGGTFTGLAVESQKYYLGIAGNRKKEKIINKIRFSTRPDYINPEVLKLAKEYKVDIIELGLQSLNDHVLELAERGHKAEDTLKAAALVKEYGFVLGLQIMPGLMGDTEESILETIKGAASLEPKFVRIYPTVVIKGTRLEEYYKSKEFIPFTLEKMVGITAKAYELFTKEGINVIRMGLQHSENLTLEKDLIAGPYHPAFGELVFSEIYKNKIISIIEKNNLQEYKELKIRVSPGEISKIRGQKNSNTKKIKEKFNINLLFIEDSFIEKGQLEIEV